MPRRAKSGITGPQITMIVAVVVAGFAGGFFLLTRSKDPFVGLNDLPIASYQDGARRMRGNEFKIRGEMGVRMDPWNTDEGRMFSLRVSDGFKTYPVPIYFPPELNSEQVVRNQEYQMKVTVGEDGVLIVNAITNT